MWAVRFLPTGLARVYLFDGIPFFFNPTSISNSLFFFPFIFISHNTKRMLALFQGSFFFYLSSVLSQNRPRLPRCFCCSQWNRSFVWNDTTMLLKHPLPVVTHPGSLARFIFISLKGKLHFSLLCWIFTPRTINTSHSQPWSAGSVWSHAETREYNAVSRNWNRVRAWTKLKLTSWLCTQFVKYWPIHQTRLAV